MGYFLGYRYLDQQDLTPIFPFGHGLSYSSFTYANLTVPCTTATEKAILNVTVDITNTTDRAGEEIAMLFDGARPARAAGTAGHERVQPGRRRGAPLAGGGGRTGRGTGVRGICPRCA